MYKDRDGPSLNAERRLWTPACDSPFFGDVSRYRRSPSVFCSLGCRGTASKGARRHPEEIRDRSAPILSASHLGQRSEERFGQPPWTSHFSIVTSSDDSGRLIFFCEVVLCPHPVEHELETRVRTGKIVSS